jgi:hypothetical protein
MTFRPNRWRALLVVTAANVLLLAASRFFEVRARSAVGLDVSFRPGVGSPVGYLAHESAYPGPGVHSGCTLVRYVAVGCRYCWNEKAQWNTLAARAAESQCGIVGVVSDAASVLPKSAYGIGADAQLIFVGMEWIAGSPPTRTPTTMIFGKSGLLVWQRVGQLTDKDVAAALIFLPRTRKK